MINSVFGAHPFKDRIWTPQIELSQDNVGTVPPEPLRVDPYLPAVGVDPFEPQGAIAIDKGRFVGLGFVGGQGSTNYRMLWNDTGKTPVTLHDGKNITPCGMSVNRMYRESGDFMVDSNTVKYRKSFMAGVGFVSSINNAHGTLRSGDRLTGYWGSTTSTTLPSYVHRGKPVRWNEKKVYVVTASASTQVSLTAAIYPGIEPEILMVYAAGSLLTTATATLAWNANAGTWYASFTGTGSSTVTTVVYAWGQAADQIAGEVIRIQSVSDILTNNDLLKFVELSPRDRANWPPAMTRYPVTTVGTGSDPDVNSDWETPSTVTAGSVYRVAEYPMSIHNPVIVAFKGVLVDRDGVAQTYTDWTNLPSSIADYRGYFSGLYHDINWRTGVITLSSNITTVTAIKVLYSYLSDPRDGAALWGEGVINLTDGGNVVNNGGPARGLPSHLNQSDVTGELRLFAY